MAAQKKGNKNPSPISAISIRMISVFIEKLHSSLPLITGFGRTISV